MTSKTHQFKIAMRVYAAELIYAAREFRAFRLLNSFFAYINKLHLHAEILSQCVNDITFPKSNPFEVQWVSCERE